MKRTGKGKLFLKSVNLGAIFFSFKLKGTFSFIGIFDLEVA